MNRSTMASGYLAKQPLIRPVHFRSVNVAGSPSANLKWAPVEAVNFMEHLYFITNLVLDYLLENELPQELMNQTLLNDPLSVLSEHRNELIAHFHKLLIAACACLCVGISIPLFGFMIACCWCSGGSNKGSYSKRHRASSSNHGRSAGRSRSRSHHRDSSDADWLALASRDSGAGNRANGSRRHRELDRRRRHGGGGQRSIANLRSGGRSGGGHSSSAGAHYRSRSAPPSMKYESTCHPCLRTLFSSNLFVLLLLIAFFAVCAFVTNEYVDNGVKQLPRALKQTADEIQVYLNNTDYEVDNLFRVNYNQLESEINQRLDSSGMIIKHKLAIASEAVALINLTEIVMEFNDTKYRLERLDRELSTLRTKLTTAKKGLGDLRKKIENCPPSQCSMLRKKYQNLNNFEILPQYENLPNVKHLIKKVNQLIDSGIVAQVSQGREEFDRVGMLIQHEVGEISPEIKTHLSLVGRRLSNLASEVSKSIRWSDQFFNTSRTSVQKLNQYTDYEQYRRYAGLAGATIILFILLCYTLGWLYGSCRPQPTARTYKTRVKTSASASFPFSCGIFTVFLLFLPMILAAIVLFFTGSVGDKVVCRVIKHPEQKQSKQIYAMLQNKFLGSDLPITAINEDKVTTEPAADGSRQLKVYRPNYADLMARCHQNQSLYKVLKLDQYDKIYLNKFSIGLDKSFGVNSASELKGVINIDAKLNQSLRQLPQAWKVALLSSQAEGLVRQSMSLSFDEIENSFARLYDNGVAISHIDIEQLVRDIQTQQATVNDDAHSDLALALIIATNFNDNLLPNITNSLLNLKEGVRHLKLRMFHGRNSFGVVISDLIAKVRSAEKQLSSSGTTLLKIATMEFADDLNGLVDQYANHVKNQVENVIGQCEQVSRSLNTTTSVLCDEIILPFNGYWLSTAASLILILPATFLAYALRGLYRMVRRTGAGAYSHHHNSHSYSYTDPEDEEVSYEEDGEDMALAYHLGHHSHHLTSHKPSSSAIPLPSAPADESTWSASSAGYNVHNSRPPPYAV